MDGWALLKGTGKKNLPEKQIHGFRDDQKVYYPLIIFFSSNLENKIIDAILIYLYFIGYATVRSAQ